MLTIHQAVARILAWAMSVVVVHVAAPPPPPISPIHSTISTNYCLSGFTATGEPVSDGIVAVNTRDFRRMVGSKWLIVTGPDAGRIVRVADHGPAAQFDIWVNDCAEASRYGARRIEIAAA